MPARQPRGQRVMVRLTPEMDKRVEELCDRLGQSKTALLSVLVGIGVERLSRALAHPDAAAQIVRLLNEKE